jgi:GTP-binding protein
MTTYKISQDKIRNIAIIAHVDHGKTTLVDAFLKQSNIFRQNQDEMHQEMILDSGELEREKGITIKAKNISVRYNDYKINIIDTPGHADFGGEVERTLNMADGCILLVDAQEGPMPQTKFVLKKALELGLKMILVINKIDKKFADSHNAFSKVQDLVLTLASDMGQLDFPVFYAIGREGKVWKEMPTAAIDANGEKDYTDVPGDIRVLLDEIINYIPAPTGVETEPFQMQVTSIFNDTHIGKYLIGKIRRGTVKLGDSITVIHNDEPNAKKETSRVKKLMVREGLEFVEIEKASAGEIVAIVGIDSNVIGGTICAPGHLEALPMIKISNPSVQIKFEANTSPFLGQEGTYVTAKQIQQRLDKEAENNISLKITKEDGGGYFVAGRGELQLSILIEELRREGFEFQIRKPEVVFQTIDGVKSEPIEEIHIEVPEQYQGAVVSELSERKGDLMSMITESGQSKFEYKILTRNLLGLRHILLTATKGNLIMNNFLVGYVPYTEQPEMYRRGVLVSSENGVAMEYSLNTIQERGDLIIPGATRVYVGMVIGINKYEGDMEVNPCKERAKSGVRRNQAEITQIMLKSIKLLTLEFALLFLAKDEILEVTPQNLRLRKQYLTRTERDWSKRSTLNDYAKQQLGIK